MKARVLIANAVTLVLELESLDYTKSVTVAGQTTVSSPARQQRCCVGREKPQFPHGGIERNELRRIVNGDVLQRVDECVRRQVDEFDEYPFASAVLLGTPSGFVLMALR